MNIVEGKAGEVINNLRTEVKNEPDSIEALAVAEALAFLVNANRTQGKEAEAFQYLSQYIESYPEQAYAHELLRGLENRRGNSAQAIAHYERALELSPNRLLSVIFLAQIYVKENRTQDAADLYAMQCLQACS